MNQQRLVQAAEKWFACWAGAYIGRSYVPAKLGSLFAWPLWHLVLLWTFMWNAKNYLEPQIEIFTWRLLGSLRWNPKKDCDFKPPPQPWWAPTDPHWLIHANTNVTISLGYLDKFEKTPSASNIILLGHCSVARVFWNLLVFSFANSKWGCPKFGNPPTIRLSLFLESGKTGRLHFSVWINNNPLRFHPRHD